MSINLAFTQMLKTMFGSPIRRATTESIITSFAGQFILIISGILVARLLGAEGRGYLALIVLFPTLLTQVGLLGVPQAITYFFARQPGASRAIVRKVTPTIIIQCLVLTIIQGIVVILYAVGKPNNVLHAGYATILVVSGMVIHHYGLAMLQGQEKFRIFNIQRIMPAALYALAIVFVFLSEYSSILIVVLVWVTSFILTGLITFHLARRELIDKNTVNEESNDFSVREIFSFGLKGMIGWAEPLETYRLDQLLCGLLLTPSALGFYVVAQAFTNLPRFLAQSVGYVAYPIISTGKSNAQSGNRIRKFVSMTVIVNTSIVLVLAILMPVLIPFFFGEVFRDSIIIAQILLFGTLLASIRRILVESVRGLGHPEVSTYAALSLFPWLAIAAPWLTITYGIEGLAVSVVLGQLISLTVAIVLIRTIRGIVFNE